MVFNFSEGGKTSNLYGNNSIETSNNPLESGSETKVLGESLQDYGFTIEELNERIRVNIHRPKTDETIKNPTYVQVRSLNIGLNNSSPSGISITFHEFDKFEEFPTGIMDQVRSVINKIICDSIINPILNFNDGRDLPQDLRDRRFLVTLRFIRTKHNEEITQKLKWLALDSLNISGNNGVIIIAPDADEVRASSLKNIGYYFFKGYIKI